MLVCFEVLRLSQQFLSHVGMEPPLPVYYQYFSGMKCLAQGHNMAEIGSIERYKFSYNRLLILDYIINAN